MAHLVPDPPPVTNYQNPAALKQFSVFSWEYGIGRVNAWGVDNPTWQYRVGADNANDVISEMALSPNPRNGLKLFKLRGLRAGMKIAIFARNETGWTRYSDYVTVDENPGDPYAASFRNSTLPRSIHTPRVQFYPFGAQQAKPPMPDGEWMWRIEDALGLIKNNVIGQAVLANLRFDVTIYPWLPGEENAVSDVHVNPAQWSNGSRPGTSVDEILLHELIHRIEQVSSPYTDRYGFTFDQWDFLTVNATNVYSGMKGRGLRKDHRGFEPLPDEHFKNPKLHFEQQEPNYLLAKQRAPSLVRTLSYVPRVWNPFVSFAEAAVPPGGP